MTDIDLTFQGTRENILAYLSENTPINYYDLKVVDTYLTKLEAKLELKREKLLSSIPVR